MFCPDHVPSEESWRKRGGGQAQGRRGPAVTGRAGVEHPVPGGSPGAFPECTSAAPSLRRGGGQPGPVPSEGKCLRVVLWTCVQIDGLMQTSAPEGHSNGKYQFSR